MSNSINRKQFLKQFGLVGVAAVGASTILSACGGGSEESAAGQAAATAPVDPCKDTAGLSEQDLAMRNNIGYIEKTEIPEQRCDNCQLYKQPENGCGGCLLFNGPVTADGWCNSWVTNQG